MGEYTREEEIALFSAAQAGDRESVAELMRRHEGLVHQVVQRQWSGGWRYAEVVHEGRIGLWQAILKYDPQRGVAGQTWRSRCWRGGSSKYCGVWWPACQCGKRGWWGITMAWAAKHGVRNRC
jgi:DNA-directed RNA polymerase specialized sigma subunit